MAKDLFVSALLDVYGSCLSEKQRVPAMLYYNEDLSLSEIAENEGITRQGVSDLIKRAEAQLRELEKECGYCEAFLRLKQISADIRSGENKNLGEMLDIIDNL